MTSSDPSGSNNKDDLLVFGYSCKLFRNDDVAMRMEGGGDFLIPWMGHAHLAIDRYDGRATMHDIRPHEALPETEADPDYFLGPEEKMIEEMCDDERYRSLDDAAAAEQQTEEQDQVATRDGAAIAFDYDSPPVQQPVQAPPPVQGPSLKTLASVLEKTAEFIASQGAQMEILMRAKEAANPKFQFLNPDNAYHPIYKQVLEKKRAKFKNPYLAANNSQDNGQLRQLSIEEVEASLRQLQENLPSAAPGAATHDAADGNAKSGNAYSKLVERIKEQNKASNPATPTPSPPPTPAPPGEEDPVAGANANNATASSDTPAPDVATPSSDEVTVEVPPMELQMLIDKTASYVCRQNLEFGQQKGAEKIGVVKKLQKEKFAFLFPENKYNTYYLFKVALYTEMLENERIQKKNQEAQSEMQELTLKTYPTLKGFFNT